jgi:hypothetical protein
MGESRGHDLDGLWSAARKNFDTSSEDAVLLLESRSVSFPGGNVRRTTVHRVVWIATEVGIEDYADLRIPYNSATSSMKVKALRTWRDGKWWPDETEISPTAVVETLPFALARADDYTTMRETMLLHDGVELPCIMETVYEIEERLEEGAGSDGIWVFPQRDPAVLVELILSIPEETILHYLPGNGAPEPQITGDGPAAVTRRWKMENVRPLGFPLIADPAAYAPYVSWSTWHDWEMLGMAITTSFNQSVVLADAITDTLISTLDRALSPADMARRVAGLVNRYTRAIHYDSRFWPLSPRPAPRTWETAYGHALDRAVLAAALMKGAGFEVEPILRSKGFGGMDTEVPGLSRFEEIALLVAGNGFEAFYDPSAGSLHEGRQRIFGRTVWRPASEASPPMRPSGNGPGPVSSIALSVTIEPDGSGNWKGTGYLDAGGVFCPREGMSGTGGGALEHIQGIAARMIGGIEVNSFDPEMFTPGRVKAGFAFELKSPEPDALGRMRFTVGDPDGGVITHLPPDVHLYGEHRSSPVILPGMMEQRLEIRLRTGGKEVTYLPESRNLENGAGRFALSTENKDGWVMMERSLKLEQWIVKSEDWPDLRILLLGEKDPASRVIILD